MALPLVMTLPVAGGTTETTAWLMGSVNGNGASTTCWFVWGPASTLLSSSTPSQAATSTSAPYVIQAQITGLTSGTTYYYAAVAQNASGTVQGPTLSFTAQSPQTATVTSIQTPPSPIPSATAPQIPHLAYPFRITANGANTVEQGTLADVFSCVRVILDCPAGECPEIPALGRPDLTFTQAPPDAKALIADIVAQEPRADEQAVVAALGDPDGPGWQIALSTSTSGATADQTA